MLHTYKAILHGNQVERLEQPREKASANITLYTVQEVDHI